MRMSKEERDMAIIVSLIGIVEELKKIASELEGINKQIGFQRYDR